MDHKLDLEALWHLADLDKDGYIDEDLPLNRSKYGMEKPTLSDDELEKDRDG